MRATIRSGVGAVALLGSLLVQGCNVQFDLDGPSQVSPGSLVDYTLNATNPGVCPVGEVDAIVIPFLSPEEIQIVGNDDLAQIILALLNGICLGEPFELPDGLVCRVEGNAVICERESGFSTPGGNPLTVTTPAGPLFTCERDGSKLTCQLSHPALAAALASNNVAQTLTCIQDGGEVDCHADRINPGQTLSSSFGLTAPFAPGVYRTFVIGGAFEEGVCRSGSSNAGGPCDTDAQCPGGTMDDCAAGICINDMTQATGGGCDDDTDCAGGESCVPCGDPNEILLPLACQQITVTATAPAMSPIAMAGAVLTLLTLALFALRRRAR